MDKNMNTIIGWEYDCFKLNMLNTSKINIFQKAEEIYHKTKIASFMKCILEELSDDEKYLLASSESIIDDVYESIRMEDSKYEYDIILKKVRNIIENISA